MTDYNEVIGAIFSGQFDDQLKELFAALRDREKHLRYIETMNARSVLKPGDQIRLKDLSPKYINGSVGTIREFKQTKAVVDLDPNGRPYGKFGAGVNLTVPLNCLEKV